jgi:hypothetical protein
VILAKTNLSEWANFRSTQSSSGWSGRGGQCANPYVLDRNPCGSSSGTGAAVSANLAAVGVGTETDGSIVCPSHACSTARCTATAARGIAGVANTGRDVNWTGHDFAQANWYAFGRLAWNPGLDAAEIADVAKLGVQLAVVVGGGHNHRFGLYDGVLVKDNHIALLRGLGVTLGEAVRAIKAKVPHTMRVEVEVSDLAKVREALESGADALLLDNMNADQIRLP